MPFFPEQRLPLESSFVFVFPLRECTWLEAPLSLSLSVAWVMLETLAAENLVVPYSKPNEAPALPCTKVLEKTSTLPQAAGQGRISCLFCIFRSSENLALNAFCIIMHVIAFFYFFASHFPPKIAFYMFLGDYIPAANFVAKTRWGFFTVGIVHAKWKEY